MESKKKLDRKNRKLKKALAFLALVKSNNNNNSNSNSNSNNSEESETPLPLPLVDLETGNYQQQMMEVKKETSPGGKSIQAQSQMNAFKGPEERIPDSDNAESVEKKNKMSAEAFAEMKKILRERNKMAMQRPKVFLTPDDMLPFKSSIDECESVVPPLYAIDLQNLLLYALQGNTCSFKPRWCKLLRVAKVSSVVLISLDGVGYSDFLDDKESFKNIKQSFLSHLEMVCPEQYSCSMDSEIFSVPLSISQVKKANVKVHEDVKREVAAKIMPIKKWSNTSVPSFKDKFSRVCLLLSSNQMKQEGYPMPVETGNNQYKGFVFSQDFYTEVKSDSPLFAIDCEMCLTTIRRNELTRVSIVAENGETIYDTLVKPRNKIINYLTKFSGITKDMLEPIDVRIEDVQRDIKELLPSDAILCGQSLNCDLVALKLFHPYVVDTSVIFNMSGNKNTKAGLRKLTGFFLNRTIQNSQHGHCSAEDAKATLDLVKLKLEKGLEFGDATISGVYFPSVQTYFLGNEGGNNGIVENVEQEDGGASPSVTSQNSLKRPHQASSDDEDTKKVKASDPEKKLNDNDSRVDSKQGSSWADSRKQYAIFNQNNSVHVRQSFFKLIDEAGRTGCLIGRDSLTLKYGKEPIERCTISSDKEAYKSAGQAVESKAFTWVNFSKFREAVTDPESSKERLGSIKRKMDKRVEKIMSKVKEKSLVVLMMTGRQDGEKVINAGTFVKIT